MVYIFIPFFFLVFKDFLIALLLSHIFTSTDAKKTKWGFKAKQGLRCLLFKCHTVCKSQKINHLVYIYPTTCLNTKVRKITHFLVSWRKYYYQLCLHITKVSTTSKKYINLTGHLALCGKLHWIFQIVSLISRSCEH